MSAQAQESEVVIRERDGFALPRVAVGTRFMKGADAWRPGQVLGQRFEIVSFAEAFTLEWDFDAHFVTYDVQHPDREVDAFPRLKKSTNVVDQLRDLGYEVVTTMFGLDYDNPEHEPWTAERLAEFKERVEAASQVEPLIDQWTLFYTTRRGARFVYVLKEPVPVGPHSEAMHKSLVRAWAQRGIALDPACSDWTRFFRLPKVMRD